MRFLRASLAMLGAALVAVLGATVGGLTAIALTAWLVPDDPFVIVLAFIALLLVLVPLGALFAIWLAALIAADNASRY
jgi:hypothetical protein